MKRIGRILLLAVGFCFASCSLFETEEEEKTPVTNISFNAEHIQIEKGSINAVSLNVTPFERVKDCEVTYSLSDESSKIISLSQESSTGLVVTAESRGSVVLIAKCEGLTAYLEVDVYSDFLSDTPFIQVNDIAYELQVGDKRTFQVGLSGGEVTDNPLFTFESSDESVVSLQSADNACIFSCEKEGFAKICISHPKSEYPSYVMVFVSKENESPVYISSSSNVYLLGEDSGTENIRVSLENIADANLSLFQFEITEGEEVIDIISNNNVVSVTPKKSGQAIIKASHPSSMNEFEIHIIVASESCPYYVDTAQSFFELKIGETVSTDIFIGGDDDGEIVNPTYSVEVSDSDVCDVSISSSVLYIKAKKSGKATISITNSLCLLPHEVYVVVSGEDEVIYYLSTLQNVIRMEEGDGDYELDINLIGGNEGDKNSFKWNVLDSSVCEVVTSFGEVSYEGRSVVYDGSDLFEAKAYINAKKAGTSDIEITHPKCEGKLVVKVIVYPEGSMPNVIPVVTGPSLIKVLKGESEDVELKLVSGEESGLEWKSDNPLIVSVEGEGLKGEVQGNGSGSCNISVSKNSKVVYQGVSISGTQEEIDSYNVITFENSIISLLKGNNGYYTINTQKEVSSDFTCLSSDSDVCRVSVINNVLCIKALSCGECKISVSNEECINTAYLMVTVYDEKTVMNPYYFEYDKFVSLLINDSVNVNVNLVGADNESIENIRWEILDEGVASIETSGSQCRLTGLSKGKTYLYAKSDKSASDAKIIVNVCETLEELNAPVLDVEKTNYLCKTGEEIYITADVSDFENNRSKIKWECSDISVVKLDTNYENAILRCLSQGDAVITLSCGTALSQKIFVSVRDDYDSSVPSISLVSYVELEEEESVTINAVITGLTDEEISNIKWSCENKTVCSFKANGNVILLKGLKSGFTTVSATLSSRAIKSQMSVVVYEKGAVHLPILTLTQGFYNLEVGGSVDVKLSYGSVKPSDSDISSIIWESDSSCISLTSNGNVCSVNALYEGSAKVRVYSPSFYNEVSFTVCVGEVKANCYDFKGSHIVRLVKGNDIDYVFTIEDSFGSAISDYSEVTIEKDDEDAVVEIKNVENTVTISGNKKGDCIFYVSHPLISGKLKVLVYVYDSEEELASSFVIAAKKENFLLRKGEEVVLELEYAGDYRELSSIKWSVDNTTCVTYTISDSKNEVSVKAKKEGDTIFTAKHEKCNKDAVFYVSVTDFSSDSKKISMVSPSVVIIQKNDGKEGDDTYLKTIKVETSLSDDENKNLIWSVTDSSIVSISGSANFCTLEGLKEGICEVTCKYDEYNYCVMVVKVCKDQAAMKSSKLFNIDSRTIFMNVGQNKKIMPFTGYNILDLKNAVYECVSDNGVIKCFNSDGSLSIDAENEGVGIIKCSDSNIENVFYVNVIVSENSGSISEGNLTSYLTAGKYVYTVNPNYPLEGASITVFPIGLSEDKWNSIEWTVSDSSICTINGQGKTCTCYPLKEGRCVVSASSVYCSNKIEFTLISSTENIDTYPSIMTSSNTLRLKVGEEGRFDFVVTAMSNVDVSKFSYKNSDNKVCSIEEGGDFISVKGLSSGQSVITVSYPGVDDINLVVSVSGIVSNLVYLSTANSFSVVGEGSSINVGVNLNNYSEVNQKNFIWTVKEGNENILLSGNGSSVVVKGLKTGRAIIECNHEKALCSLEMVIDVVDSSEYSPVYMQTDTVVSMEEGEKTTLEVTLKNGSESENGYFNWSVADNSKDLIKVTSSGNKALVQALSSGVARITVTHPSCVSLPSVDIIVVINEVAQEDSLVISTDSTIIEGKLSESYKTVNVNLVGGSSEQQLLFSWEIISQDSSVRNSDGTSLNVVSLVSQGGNQNIVKYLNEGTAIVRVKNSATSYYLDIKFIINEYTSVKFEKTNVTISEYESTTVSVTSPSSKSIVYNSSDESIARAYGTNSVCCIEGLKVGYAVITAKCSDGSYEDKISVRVNEAENDVPVYISTSTNLVTLNTTDTSGTSIKGTLCGKINGKDVSSSESDNIVWTTESGKNNVIKFAATNSLKVTGSEVKIIPVGSGTETIVLTHSKTSREKKVYVTVNSVKSSLSLDSVYGTFEKGDIGSITALLSGVASSEEQNIVWATSDSTKVSLVDGGKDVTSVKGGGCLFRCKAICEEGVIITCTYKDIVKSYTVFIKEFPTLRLLVSQDTVRTGETRYYNITCTPQESISKLSYQYSSSSFIKEKEDGVLMTGLIRNQTELSESGDTPPSGITVPYFKVTGGTSQGSTDFYFECDTLSACLTINTDNTVKFEITKYERYNSSGKLEKSVENPMNVEASAWDKYVRVYYNLSPEVDVDVFKGSVCTSSLVDSFREGTVTMYNRKNTGTTGRYVDIYRDSSGANWGDIVLKVDNKEVGRIRISFSMGSVNYGTGYKFSYTDGVPTTFHYDVENGFITGSGTEAELAIPKMTLSYSAPYVYAYYDGDERVLVSTSKNLFEGVASFRGSESLTTVVSSIGSSRRKKIEFEWPTYYGQTGKYSKTFVLYEEIRK